VAHVPSYLEGVETTFQNRDVIPLVPTRTTIDSAAAQLALQRFVFSHELDLSRLRRGAVQADGHIH
jgi:hypothetical protein